MRMLQFSLLEGNRSSLTLLKRSIQLGKLPNFILLSGVMGTGKSSSAEIAALALTCDNPADGEPCLKCPHCQEGMAALETTGQSSRIKKINLAMISKKSDVENIIREIFVFQNTTANCVYILEELQASGGDFQSALLEEVSRLPKNVYLIGTTTKQWELKPELVSRTIPFRFNRLSLKESKRLMERLARQPGYDFLYGNSAVQELIYKFSVGVPRVIVNMADFFKETKPSLVELREFLGIIPKETFITFFTTLCAEDAGVALTAVKDFTTSQTMDTLLPQLKSFVLSVVFACEGVADDFNKAEKKLVEDLFRNGIAIKVANRLRPLTLKSSSEDLQLALFDVRLLLMQRTLTEVVTERKSDAVKQQINLTTRPKQFDNDAGISEMEPVKLSDLFGG